MKKVFLLNMMCLMAISFCLAVSCTTNGNETNKGDEVTVSYVDLGLPSGTKWKSENEANAADAEYDFFTYDEAVSQFGNRLPTKEQCDELKAECKWTWTGSGYKVTGPNGNFITLPAAGFRDCGGGVYFVGSYGYYWSSTPEDSGGAWCLGFDSGSVGMDSGYLRCRGQSVRLVQD